MTPLVSVLMPVYNAEKFLASTINSILIQTFVDFEFLIADDASTDKSLDVIRGFKDKRIKLITNDKNLGYVKTLNNLISVAQGKYLARQDNDDISAKRRLELQVRFMESNSAVSLCGTNALVFGEQFSVTLMPERDKHLKAALLFQNDFVHPSVMIKHQTVIDFKQPLFDEKLILAEDYDAWFRISQRSEIANIKTPLIMYRWHSASESRLKTDQQSAKAQTVSDLVFLETLEWDLSEEEKQIKRLIINRDALVIDEFVNIVIFFEKVLKKNYEIKYYNQSALHEICLFFLVYSANRISGVGSIRKWSILLSQKIFQMRYIGLTFSTVFRRLLYKIWYTIVPYK